MKTTSTLKIKQLVLAVMALGAMAASHAQGVTGASTVQRDVNQENRIEQGLQSGQLSTQEAGKLQKEEAHVDRMQARDLKDGKLTDAEKQKLTQAQNKVSQDIHADKTNAVKGDPQSASSQRMQADVQRNANQQSRIEQGIKSDNLNKRQAASLERGQARVDAREAKVAQNGHVSAAEQRRVQRAENRQSRRIHRQKHDA